LFGKIMNNRVYILVFLALIPFVTAAGSSWYNPLSWRLGIGGRSTVVGSGAPSRVVAGQEADVDGAAAQEAGELFSQGHTLYLDGEVEEAIQCLKKAVALGYADAQCLLGKILLVQPGKRKEGIRYLQQAIERGNEGARSHLDCNVKAEEQEYVRRGGIAFEGWRSNLFRQGAMTLHNACTVDDIRYAFELIERAANLGEVDASIVLGIKLYYEDNKNRETEQKARKYLKLAATGGSTATWALLDSRDRAEVTSDLQQTVRAGGAEAAAAKSTLARLR
jgi:TPR repeat protein